jgi:hypothetical protein
MINDRRYRTEEIIKSAAEMPDIDPGARKRVLRAAKEAQRERTLRRRLQWALGGSAAAIVLAAIYGASSVPDQSPTQYAPGVMGQPAPTITVEKPDTPKSDAPEADAPGRKTRVR